MHWDAPDLQNRAWSLKKRFMHESFYNEAKMKLKKCPLGRPRGARKCIACRNPSKNPAQIHYISHDFEPWSQLLLKTWSLEK